jgi:uncharacterized integral membrane protein
LPVFVEVDGIIVSQLKAVMFVEIKINILISLFVLYNAVNPRMISFFGWHSSEPLK